MHISEDGARWVAINVSRAFLLDAEDIGAAIVEMLDGKINRMGHDAT